MTYRDELAEMVRIEIVVNGSDVALVRDLLQGAGVVGFTMVSGVAGLGHAGYHQGSLLFNEHDAQALLLAVAPADRADPLITGLRTLFTERPGVMFVSDCYVGRPEYFT